jgi:hypothetical protein
MTEVFAKAQSLSLFSLKSFPPAQHPALQVPEWKRVARSVLPNEVDSYEQNYINKNVQFFFYFLNLFNITLNFNLS